MRSPADLVLALRLINTLAALDVEFAKVFTPAELAQIRQASATLLHYLGRWLGPGTVLSP